MYQKTKTKINVTLQLQEQLEQTGISSSSQSLILSQFIPKHNYKAPAILNYRWSLKYKLRNV